MKQRYTSYSASYVFQHLCDSFPFACFSYFHSLSCYIFSSTNLHVASTCFTASPCLFQLFDLLTALTLTCSFSPTLSISVAVTSGKPAITSYVVCIHFLSFCHVTTLIVVLWGSKRTNRGIFCDKRPMTTLFILT